MRWECLQCTGIWGRSHYSTPIYLHWLKILLALIWKFIGEVRSVYKLSRKFTNLILQYTASVAFIVQIKQSNYCNAKQTATLCLFPNTIYLNNAFINRSIFRSKLISLCKSKHLLRASLVFYIILLSRLKRTLIHAKPTEY